MEAIGAWLASKLGKMIVYGLAAAAMVLVPVVAVQYVTINGAPFFGGGLRGQVASLTDTIENPDTGLRGLLAQARRNRDALDAGLGRCNASLASLEAMGKADTARSEANLAAAQARGNLLQRRVGALLAKKPGPDLCASADALILGELP